MTCNVCIKKFLLMCSTSGFEFNTVKGKIIVLIEETNSASGLL